MRCEKYLMTWGINLVNSLSYLSILVSNKYYVKKINAKGELIPFFKKNAP